MNAISCDEITSMLNRQSDALMLRVSRMISDGWQILYFWSPAATERPEQFRFVSIGPKMFWKKRKRVT